jgi:hypothetical protein
LAIHIHAQDREPLSLEQAPQAIFLSSAGIDQRPNSSINISGGAVSLADERRHV